MKKHHSLLLALVLITLSSETYSDIAFKNLKGRVKSINEVFYNVEVSEEGDEMLITEGDTTYSQYYIFDEKGQLTAERSIFGTIKCVYDSKGYRIAEYTFDGQGYYKTVGYSTGKNGKYSTDIAYNADGSVDGITSYKYNETGSKIERVYKSATSSFVSTTTYSYDENGNATIVVMKHSYGYEYLDYKSVIEYSNNICRSTHTEYAPIDSLKERTVYTCDSMDNYLTQYHYDSKGAEIEGWRNTAQYRYDDKGNWIWRLSSRGIGYYQLSKRTIEYYD